jgi:hypothetical protein
MPAVASGRFPTGERWTILVEPDPSGLLTLLDVEDGEGRSLGAGGFGGEPLPAGHLVNVSVHWPGSGPTQLVGRVAQAVAAVRLEFAGGGASAPVTTVGDPAAYGLRFFAAQVDSAHTVVAVTALDPSGTELDRVPVRSFPRGY